jgi:hypothetical protein
MATNNPGATEAGDVDAPGEAQLLVSEFPPPPFYYKQAASLSPPPIPIDALTRGTRRAAAAAARARAESVRIRLGENTPDSDAILGGAETADDEEGDVVAVFGEIVEVRSNAHGTADEKEHTKCTN